MFYRIGKKIIKENIDLYFSRSGRLYVGGPLGTISNRLFFSFEMINDNIKRSLCGSTIKHLLALLNFSIYSTK